MKVMTKWIRGSSKALLLACLLIAMPGTVQGQGFEIRAGYSGAALSTPGWSPGFGPHLGVVLGGRWGSRLRIEYRSQGRDGGEIPSYCGGTFACTVGPFHEELIVRALGIGVDRMVLRRERLDVLGVLRGGFFWQGRHLTHLETGEERDRADVIDFGLGLGIEARLVRRVLGVSPVAWATYDRIIERECLADASCYGGRNHLEVGLGVTVGF